MVKDTAYYELLGVDTAASNEQIRKAYYKSALKYHPDKNVGGDRAEAEAKFKAISEAYQVLSDETLRRRYDEFGVEGARPEGGFMDPHEFFRSMFGGEPFVDIIGEISLATLMMDARDESERQAGTDSGTTSVDVNKRKNFQQRQEENQQRAEEMQKITEARVKALSEKLTKKLQLYTEGLYTLSEFREYIHKEATNLRRESYGPQLLHSIGYIYSLKAKQVLGKNSLLGLASVYHSFRETGHLISNAASAYSAARAVQREGEAAEQERIFEVIWKMSALDIEFVLVRVCELVLQMDPTAKSIAKEQQRQRAVALKCIGDTYKQVSDIKKGV